MIIDQTLGSTIGAALLGGFADAILYGIACSQCFTFVQSQPQRKDGVVLRCSVGILWVLATVHTALVIHPLYWYMVQNFGDTRDIDFIAWGIKANIVVAAFSDAIVRSSFIYRLWKLSERNHSLTWPLAVLNVALFGVTLTLGIWSCVLKTLEEFRKISYLYYTTFSLVVFTDICITASLIWLFSKMKNNSQSTDSVLSRLISYTVNTGLATCVVSIASLIMYSLMPENYIFFAIGFPLSGLYVNSLLASFNARQFLSPRRETFPPNSLAGRRIFIPSSQATTIHEPFSRNQITTSSLVVPSGLSVPSSKVHIMV